MPRNNRPRRRSDANASSGPAVMLSGAAGSASAPRSKAGCWTCRIRRKRCDEQQDENGSCQACVRLDIECLGWGQRRPDWCRDKDKLIEYKLRLKRKLCSRAGTRPSAATLAARQQQQSSQQLGTSQQQRRIDDQQHPHDITRAPSGESPSTSYSRSDDEMDHRNAVNGTGFDEEEETDDSWAFNSAFYASPLFPQSALPQPTTTTNVTHPQLPLHPFSPSFTSPSVSVSVASVTALSQKLHAHLPSILAKSPLPAEYHTLTTQLLDLLSYKTFSSPSSSTCLNAEQEIAQRARKMDEALTRLNNRNAFDGSFESMTGFEFNPIAFLTASNITPSVGGSSVYSTSPLDPYSSPLGMSSPDLIYETFSQFSGSSAPTSPAAPMLAMTASPAMLSSSSPLGVGSPLLYGYQPQTGFDSYQSLNAFSFNASTSTGSSSTGSGYDSTPSSSSTLSMGMGMTTAADDGMMMMGALGLSNDFFAQTDYSATGAMSFTLPPPPSTAPAKPMPLITTTTTTAPSTPSPSSTSIAQQQQDSDPLQIHYDSCSLLLQSILSSSSSSSVEETLQRLTSKFSSMITNPSSISSSPSMAPLTTAVKPEYLFSATLAGALCPKNSYRRDLFRRVVRGIEERQLVPGAVGEAGLLLDQI